MKHPANLPKTNTTSDRLLIQRAQKDPNQFGALYEKYAKQVYSYISYRIRHNATDAEDLLQEVFSRAFKHLPRFKWKGLPYLSYLYRIAHNVLINHFQSRKWAAERLKPLEEVDVPIEIGTDIETRLARESLWMAVQKLPKDQKTILLLYYRKQMKVSEISKILGKTPNAVKLHLARARKRLKTHLNLPQMAQWKDYSQEHPPPPFLKSSLKSARSNPPELHKKKKRKKF